MYTGVSSSVDQVTDGPESSIEGYDAFKFLKCCIAN